MTEEIKNEELKHNEIFKESPSIFIRPIKNIDGTITITCSASDFNELKYSLTLMNYKRLQSRGKMNKTHPRKDPRKQRTLKPYYYFNELES